MLLAEALTSAGDTDGALVEIEPAVRLIEQRLAEDPANMSRLHSVLEMIEHQAKLLIRISDSPSMDASRRLDLLRQARLSLQRCKALADAAIRSGTLPALDVTAMERFPDHLDEIDAAMQRLVLSLRPCPARSQIVRNQSVLDPDQSRVHFSRLS
jgi:hypothetical protein